jgi:alpha-glucosidase
MGQLHRDDNWWKEGIIYQIYPRSFFDADGDGVGDLDGIRTRLDYLRELGVSGIWISPINKSPMFDFGYDISDYREIDPVFGDMEAFRRLLDEAHRRNIGVIMDMVFNHTSVLHPWFIESRSSKDNPYRDFYVWRKPKKGGRVPNNWKASFGGSCWSFDEKSGEYYLHSFLPEQPDLNWANPRCRKAIFDELEFWLKEGVDGFRLDVINLIGKDPEFRDNPFTFGWPPRPYEMQRHLYDRNSPATGDYLRQLRRLLNRYPGSFGVGEIYLDKPVDQELAASFTGVQDQLHLAFDFSLTFSPWSARRFGSIFEGQYRAALRYGGTPCFVFSNHDVVRALSRYAPSSDREMKEAVAKLIGVMLLTQGGTPFLYMGEEIGMENAAVPRSRLADPVGIRYWPFHKGRDGERLPMQWDGGPCAGFSSNPDARPWLPLHPNYQEVNVADQQGRAGSVLSCFKALIALRSKYPALRRGGFTLIQAEEKELLVYLREADTKERFLVCVNFSSKRHQSLKVENGRWRKLFSTHASDFSEQGTQVVIEQESMLAPLEGMILISQ